jgi:hypothetical protein
MSKLMLMVALMLGSLVVGASSVQADVVSSEAVQSAAVPGEPQYYGPWHWAVAKQRMLDWRVAHPEYRVWVERDWRHPRSDLYWVVVQR